MMTDAETRLANAESMMNEALFRKRQYAGEIARLERLLSKARESYDKVTIEAKLWANIADAQWDALNNERANSGANW